VVAGWEDHVEFIRSHGNRQAGLPFSDAVRVGDTLYLSGAMGVLPETMKLAPGGMEAEARQMFQNIARTLEQNGLSFDNVFKCLVMLADMNEWPAFNKIYLEYFNNPDRLPARSAFGVNGLALGGRVEMEVTACAREK
jgi:reactive intermediate/imine deaminase